MSAKERVSPLDSVPAVWDKGEGESKGKAVGATPDRPSADRDGGFTRLHAFLTVFVIVYLMEAMGGMYIVSAIQNIEKQFRLPSKMSGFLVSASDIGYIPTVIFVAYFGSRGNRARWIGAGAFGMAFAYIMIASPNFLFPVPSIKEGTYTDMKASLAPSTDLLSDNASLSLLLQYPLIKDRFPSRLAEGVVDHPSDGPVHPVVGVLLARGSLSSQGDLPPARSPFVADFALLHEAVAEADRVVNGENTEDATRVRTLLQEYVRRRNSSLGLMEVQRATNAPFAFCSSLVNQMQRKIMAFKCMDGGSSRGPFIVLAMALFILGIGRTLPWSLGVPLIDDNVSKKSMPAYFGAISFLRILGPISGFLMASFVNKLYFDFHPPEGLTPQDSSWIGAWWLGFIIIGCATFLPSLALLFFPSRAISVPSADGKACKEINFLDKHTKTDQKGVSERIKHFMGTYKSVLSSKVYTYSALGRILDIMAFKGYMVFLPKYLENHFGIPRYLVHRYMAIMGIFGFACGSGVGGLVMRRFKLDGKQAALWVLMVSFLNILVYTSKMFIACESPLSAIGTQRQHAGYNLTDACNADCACPGSKLFPVCDKNGQAFFSPCHAGCRDVIPIGEGKHLFSHCSCTELGSVQKEWCKSDCGVPTVLFFATVIIGAFIGGMGVVPGLLILIRSVPPASRSAALGLQGFMISLFGTLPSPIIWGFIVDSACRIWEHSCGGRGSCSVYDPAMLRIRLHLAYTIIRVIALIFDVLVYREGDSINILEEKDETVTQEVTRNSIKLRDLSTQ